MANIDMLNAKMVYTTLKASWDIGLKSAPEPFTAGIFEKDTTTSKATEYVIFLPCGGLTEVDPDLRGKIMRDWKNGKMTVAVKDYEAGFIVSRNMLMDNQINGVQGQAQKLAVQASRLPDELVTSLINGGFTTTKTFDGKYWFADDHDAYGVTFSNKGTAALSEDSFYAGLKALKDIKVQSSKDDASIPLITRGADLVCMVPTALEQKADELFKSETKASGATNPLYQKAKVIVNPSLTSETAWFIFVLDEIDKPVVYLEREAPTLLSDGLSDATTVANWGKEHEYLASARATVFAGRPELAYGSTGAA